MGEHTQVIAYVRGYAPDAPHVRNVGYGSRLLPTTLRVSPASRSLAGLVQMTFKPDWNSVESLDDGFRAIEDSTGDYRKSSPNPARLDAEA